MNFGDIISSISKYVPSLGARRPKREKEMAADVRPKPLGTPTQSAPAHQTGFSAPTQPQTRSAPAHQQTQPVFSAPAMPPTPFDDGEVITPFKPFDRATLDLRVKKAWAGFKAAYPDVEPSPGVLMAVASHPKIPTNGIYNAFPVEAREAMGAIGRAAGAVGGFAADILTEPMRRSEEQRQLVDKAYGNKVSDAESILRSKNSSLLNEEQIARLSPTEQQRLKEIEEADMLDLVGMGSVENVAGKTAGAAGKAIRGAALSVQERAVASGLAENLGDLPTYDIRKIAPNAKKVLQYFADDADTSIKIALSEADAPTGLFSEEFFVAAAKKAAAEGDVDLTRRLVNSKTVEEGTVLGQRIRALGELNPEDPIVIIKKVQKARKARAARGIKVPADLADDEIKAVLALTDAVNKAKEAIKTGADSLDYGRALVVLEDYVGVLHNPRSAMTARELIGDISKEEVVSALKRPWRLLKPAADLTKAVKATWDNSFAGRQGRKLLTTSPKQWTKEFGESWVDLFKTAKNNNDDVMRELRANIYATPEYRAGNYKHLDINIREEDIPTTLQEKIPVLGRFFRASDTAYSAMALKTRVWAMDEALAIGRALGEDMTDDWMKGAARYANVMGGRGRLGKLEPVAGTLNRALFSPRNATAHLDFLSAHITDPTVPTVLKKKAARNLLQWGIGNATVLATADALGYSVEWDPRSSNFGTIRVGSRRIDVTGGAKGYFTLIARLGAWLASYKDEDIGVYKSSTTDEMITGADARGFGGRTAEDVTIDFLSNKAAPTGTVILDVLRGVDFKGEPTTLPGEIKNLGVPIMAEQSSDLDATPGEESNKALMLLLEFSGFSVQNYLAPDNPLIKEDKEYQEAMEAVDKNGKPLLSTREKFYARFDWRNNIRPELERLASQKNKKAATGWQKFLAEWDERNEALQAAEMSPDSDAFPKDIWEAELRKLLDNYPAFANQYKQVPEKLILR